jgi:bifunctional DNase/RNase
MIRVVVDSIRVSLLTQHRVVVLRETDSRRYLPIWVGAFEADAIAMAIQGQVAQRPLTHDLLRNVITTLGARVRHIFINDMQENTFFAQIVVDQLGRTLEIDARPSDAIALAVRGDIPIFVAEQVIDQAAVQFDEDEQNPQFSPPARSEAAPAAESEKAAEPEINEDSLSIFRNFINTLKLDPPPTGDQNQS